MKKSPVLIVGSVAFDDLEMPSGTFENVIGGAVTYSSIAASLLLASLAPAAAAPPASCAGKYVGRWTHTGGNNSTVTADGRATCEDHAFCVKGATWTCDGNVFIYTNSGGTWNYTLAPEVIDWIIDSFVTPRIMASTLKVHPAAVLIAALIAANLLGLLGVVIAAPFLATVTLLGKYIMRKLFDLDPWPEPPAAEVSHIGAEWFARLKALYYKNRLKPKIEKEKTDGQH